MLPTQRNPYLPTDMWYLDTFYYYDGPMLFTTMREDDMYLASAYCGSHESTSYFYVKVDEQTLADLKAGLIDIREPFVTADTVYSVEFIHGSGNEERYSAYKGSDICDEVLAQAGVKLRDTEQPS